MATFRVRDLVVGVAGIAILLGAIAPVARVLRGSHWAGVVPWIWIGLFPAVGLLVCRRGFKPRTILFVILADILLILTWLTSMAPDFGSGVTATYGDVPWEVMADWHHGLVNHRQALHMLTYRVEVVPLLALVLVPFLLLASRACSLRRSAAIFLAIIGCLSLYEVLSRPDRTNVHDWITGTGNYPLTLGLPGRRLPIFESAARRLPIRDWIYVFVKYTIPNCTWLELASKAFLAVQVVALLAFVVAPLARLSVSAFRSEFGRYRRIASEQANPP